MPPRSLSQQRRQRRQRSERKLLQRLIDKQIELVISVVVPHILNLIQSSYVKIPYHTSLLTGYAWVQELLEGHPERIRTELGMHKETFLSLVDELYTIGVQDSRSVTVQEQLAIYLYTCVTGLTIRHVGERFQRANETISRYFRKMTTIFSSPPFFTKYVSLPSTNQPPSLFFFHNPKLFPFFEHALGAIDGSHIHAAPPRHIRPLCRNRKGFYSQNCLFACTFDLLFSYVLTGWEGSASDARIYQDALTKGLSIPRGWYYLADAGFPHCPQLLVPYRGVRYHLAEWGRANIRPQNPKELYNLRHAQARNVIERIFGVLKKRFRILLLAPEYQYDIQARIPASLCAIHNFLRVKGDHGGCVGEDYSSDGSTSVYSGTEDLTMDEAEIIGEDPAQNEATRRRDGIAQQMWESYQQVLEERRMAMMNDEEVDEFLYNTDEDEDEGRNTDESTSLGSN